MANGVPMTEEERLLQLIAQRLGQGADISGGELPMGAVGEMPMGPPNVADRGPAGLDTAKIQDKMAASQKQLVAGQPVANVENSTITGKDSSDVTRQRLLTMSPEEYQQIYDEAKKSSEIQELIAGRDKIAGMIEQYNNIPSRLDISPVMALAQAWYPEQNKGILQAYKRPDTAEERQAKSIGLEMDLQKRGNEINSAIRDLIKTQRGGYELEKLAELMNWQVGRGIKPPPAPRAAAPGSKSAMGKLWDDFSKERQRDQTMKGLLELPSVLEALRSDTSFGKEVVKGYALKMLGEGGKPSDADVARVSGTSVVPERFKQWVNSTWGTGGFTPKNQEEMRGVVKELGKIAKRRFDAMAKNWAATAKTRYPDIKESPEQIVDFFTKSAAQGAIDFSDLDAPSDKDKRLEEIRKTKERINNALKDAGY